MYGCNGFDLFSVWGFFAIIIFLLIDFCISRSFADAAHNKGYFEKRYFWMCFFFGIAGYLLVVALPDRYCRPPRKPEN